MKDFRQLAVWGKAHAMTLMLYKMTTEFPKDELFGLTAQIRRCAASIPANIAEGCGRRSDGEFVRFLQIKRGSAAEVEYHLLLVRDLRFLSDHEHKELERKLVEVQRMLTSLVTAVQESAVPQFTRAKRGPGQRLGASS